MGSPLSLERSDARSRARSVHGATIGACLEARTISVLRGTRAQGLACLRGRFVASDDCPRHLLCRGINFSLSLSWCARCRILTGTANREPQATAAKTSWSRKKTSQCLKFTDFCRFLLCRIFHVGIEVTSYDVSTRDLITRHKQGYFVSVEL